MARLCYELALAPNTSIYMFTFEFPVSLSCGGTTYDNCTYLSQASTTTPGSGCEYKICPMSTSVNRIRLDFTVSKHVSKYKTQDCLLA